MDPSPSSGKLLLWMKSSWFLQANTEASFMCELWEMTQKAFTFKSILSDSDSIFEFTVMHFHNKQELKLKIGVFKLFVSECNCVYARKLEASEADAYLSLKLLQLH